MKQLTANLTFNINQPLLRNRGRFVNRIPLMTAQSNVKIAEFNLRDRLLTLVNTAEGAYWSVISARERLRVQITARDAAKSYLDFMQQQLDLGALSPLDIYNPKQALAQQELARFAGALRPGAGGGHSAPADGRRSRSRRSGSCRSS